MVFKIHSKITGVLQTLSQTWCKVIKGKTQNKDKKHALFPDYCMISYIYTCI